MFKTILAILILLAVSTATLAQAPGPAASQQPTIQQQLPLRLIFLKYADPSDIAWLFGGQVIQGGGQYGGQGGNSGGYGGSNQGSSGYGNQGSSGSSRGGNRNGGSYR